MDSCEKEMKFSADLESLLRVNHAGEWAAVQIYQGQLRVLGDSKTAPHLCHMLQQESKHHHLFENELKKRNIHSTLFEPFWEKTAYSLGVFSALLGTKAAMACTVAVEEIIEEHYSQQLCDLPSDIPEEIHASISQFYQEEVEHKNIGISCSAQEMKGYKSFTKVIKAGCRLAIWLSKRL